MNPIYPNRRPFALRRHSPSHRRFQFIKRRLNISFKLKPAFIITLTLIFFIIAFYSLTSLTKVKHVTCINSNSQNQTIEAILTQTFANRSLIFLTSPKIQKTFQQLYLNPPASIIKKYPSTLILDCQNTHLKAYITLTQPQLIPTSLQQWLQLATTTFTNSQKPTHLAIFQQQKSTLNLLPLNLTVSTQHPNFFVFNLSDSTLSAVWSIFFWLKQLNPDQTRYQTIITPFSALIFDPNTNLYYLLDPTSLPKPNSILKVIDQLHQKDPNFKLIDWRFNRLTIF